MYGMPDDEEDKWLGGSLGEQAAAPRTPAAPPAVPAPDDVLPPIGMGAPPVLPSGPADAPIPPTGLEPPPATVPIKPYQPQAVPPIPPSRTVTPAEAGNLAAVDANARAQAENAQQEGAIRRQQAEAQAVQADANAEASNSYLAERERISLDAEKRLAARRAQADQDFEAFRKFGIKDPQADQSVGRRILTGIAVGLGAYAQGIQGGQNNALAIIQRANADNIARQKGEQEKLFMVAERSGKGVEEARQERDDAFKQLDLKHSAMLQNSADRLKAELARTGVPAEQIATNASVQGLEAEALKLREHTLRSIANDETQLARADIVAAAKRHQAGAGGGGAIIPKLVKMKEEGASDSEIAAVAARAGVSPKAYLPSLANVRQTMKGQKTTDVGDVFGPGGKVVGNISTGDPALDRKRSEEVSKANAVYADLQATLSELEKLRARGTSLPSIKGFSVSDLASKREALHSHALIQLKEMAKLGVLAGPDMAIMEQQLGSGIATSAGVGGSKIGELKKIVDRGHEKFLDSVGLDGSQVTRALKGGAQPAESGTPAPKAEKSGGKNQAVISRAREVANAPDATPGERAQAIRILRSYGERP